MNRDLLSKAVGGIDERYLAEALATLPEGASEPSERIGTMKIKRIVTLALAAVLLLSLGIVAHAAYSAVSTPEAAEKVAREQIEVWKEMGILSPEVVFEGPADAVMEFEQVDGNDYWYGRVFPHRFDVRWYLGQEAEYGCSLSVDTMTGKITAAHIDARSHESEDTLVYEDVYVGPVDPTYPEGETEYFEIPNNLENESLGTRKVPFSRELYIERDDFMAEPVKKYFRLYPGNEVRLMNAYFVTCTSYETDGDGKVTCVHCTYDPETRQDGREIERKVKGTIHWVNAATAIGATVRLYENLIDEEKGVYNEDGSLNLNPNSRTVIDNCVLEPSLANAKAYESFQFVRNGFFCVDYKDSKEGSLVFNRVVSLKSSFKIG